MNAQAALELLRRGGTLNSDQLSRHTLKAADLNAGVSRAVQELTRRSGAQNNEARFLLPTTALPPLP